MDRDYSLYPRVSRPRAWIPYSSNVLLLPVLQQLFRIDQRSSDPPSSSMSQASSNRHSDPLCSLKTQRQNQYQSSAVVDRGTLFSSIKQVAVSRRSSSAPHHTSRSHTLSVVSAFHLRPCKSKHLPQHAKSDAELTQEDPSAPPYDAHAANIL